MQFHLNPNPSSSSSRISGPYTRTLIEEMLLSHTITSAALARIVGSSTWVPVHEALDITPSIPTEEDFTPLIELLFDQPAILEKLFLIETLPPSTRIHDLFTIANELGIKKVKIPTVFSHLSNPLVYAALIRELKKVNWGRL